MRTLSRLFRKLTKKAIIAVLAILIIGIPFLYLTLLNSKPTLASWYDDNWNYRQAITVTVSSSSSDITNLETLVTVDTTGITAKINTNCEDLRFTNQAGKLLPYYAPSCSDNSAANKIWVMLDLVPKNTTTYTLYIYYGNPSASAVSDANKFRLFNGLVGYWALNEASGNRADSSVNSNTLTDNNTVTSATGQYSNAGQFTAANTESLSINSNSTLVTGNIDFTVAAWVYLDSESGVMIPISKLAAASDVEYEFGYNNTTDRFAMTYTNGDAVSVVANTFGAVSTGTWYLLIGWYDATADTLNITVNNGAVDSLADGGVKPPGNLTGLLGIGIRGADGTYPWNGRIDDVRLYKRVLTADERTQLYTNPGTIASTANATTKPSTSFATEEKAPGPIAYWKFDEGQGTSANDSSSNKNVGTLAGTTKPTWQPPDQCLSDKCLYFDGLTSKITVANVITGVQTISMWVKPTTTASTALIDFDGGTHKLTTDASSVLSATGFTSPTIYVNGVPNGTLTANTWQLVTVTTGTAFNSTSSLTIGLSGSTYFNGYIDEVKIYPSARTAAQVLTDYNSRGSVKGAAVNLGNAAPLDGAVPQVYLKMEEGSGTSGNDTSGNGRTGTLNGGSTWTSGKYGKGVKVDGVSGSNVSIGDFSY